MHKRTVFYPQSIIMHNFILVLYLCSTYVNLFYWSALSCNCNS